MSDTNNLREEGLIFAFGFQRFQSIVVARV
jgi:hypothetical protein